MTKNTPTPEDFNLDEWLTDAALPEESVTVYKRPDLVAELSDLKRRYEIERRAVEGENAVGEAENPVAAEYEEALRKFADSALTIYVRALTSDELNSLKKDAGESDEDFGYRTLSKAIIAVRVANGERRPVEWNTPMVKALNSKIGDPQARLIVGAYTRARDLLPTVDADFLRNRSGHSNGEK